MNQQKRISETAIIFLAMFWGGGGPYTIAQIIAVCDWVNRSIPSKNDMEDALNYLLATGLVEEKDGSLFIPKHQSTAFDAFRRRKRKDRFDTAQMYLGQFPEDLHVSPIVTLTDSEYREHITEYTTAFAEVLQGLNKKGN